MIRRRIIITIIYFLFLNLSLTFSQSITGTIVNRGNQPAVGVLIEIQDIDKATYTNSIGKFTLLEVMSGSYLLKISGDDIVDKEIEVIVGAGFLVLGNIIVVESDNKIQDDESDIAIISIGDLDSNDDEDQAISSILTSGDDVFQDAASYRFWSARFRVRGYDNIRSHLYINGMRMNDLDDGRVYWSAWGGLNDVMRNRDSELSLNPTNIGFGGIGGSSSIDLSPSAQRPGTQARYSIGNRSYVHRVALTHNSGESKSGWSYSLSASRRWGNEGYIEGTFYDAYAYFAAVEKKLNESHRFSLTIMGAPLKRGRSGGSFQEAYDLKGSVYYNPYWGYQNSEKRNSRVYKSHLPTGIFQHKWKINLTTSLTTSIGFQTGRYGSTGLDWYLAPDPRPDYYRKLPSWQQSQGSIAQAQEFYRENPDLLQIQWDQLYQINKNKVSTVNDVNGVVGNNLTGRLSSYIVQEQRFDNNRISFNTQLETSISNNLTITGGIQYYKEVAENFKVLDDLMGGEFYVDFDEFAIRDFPGDKDIIQNDLNNPNRILYEGDIFGYHYDINGQRAAAWGEVEYVGNKIDIHVAAEVSNNSFYRTGYYKVGKFPDNSFGDSEKQTFNNFGLKGGITYKLDGRNYFYANGTYRTESPFSRFSYLSARTRDEVVSDLKSETIYGGEAGYILRFPSIKGRVTGYYTKFKDQIENISFYHDEERSFVNYVMNGVDKRHMGVELGIEGNLTSTWSLEVAGAVGEYIYTSRPTATISQDNNAETIDEGRVVYLKNFYVPGTPQTAASLGINYRSPKYWFANLNINYFDRSYLDFNPDRRTAFAVELVNKEEQPYVWNSIIAQQQFDSQMTVDLFAGKSWRVDDYYIAANVSVNNILNNQNFITGGYEQYRFDYEGKDVNRFPPRYFYAYGINYSINVSVRF